MQLQRFIWLKASIFWFFNGEGELYNEFIQQIGQRYIIVYLKLCKYTLSSRGKYPQVWGSVNISIFSKCIICFFGSYWLFSWQLPIPVNDNTWEDIYPKKPLDADTYVICYVKWYHDHGVRTKWWGRLGRWIVFFFSFSAYIDFFQTNHRFPNDDNNWIEIYPKKSLDVDTHVICY